MFQKILELQSQGEMCVLVTITATKGSTPREVGAKMLVTQSSFFGTIGGGAAEWMALEKARTLLRSEESQILSIPLNAKSSQCCGGTLELFFDLIRPKPQLFLFGAGHISQAMLEVMAGSPFECHVIDERSEWIEAAQRKKFQLSNLSLTTNCDSPLAWIEKNQAHWNCHSAYAVVVTHDHDLDEAIVEKICSLPSRYLGMIGSRTKRQRFFAHLEAKGHSTQQLARIRCPMGLQFGGKSPKEVALGIAVELMQVHHQKSQARDQKEVLTADRMAEA